MTGEIGTSPFGRRRMTLGQLATHALIARAIEHAGEPGANVPAAVNKWQLFRTLTGIRQRLGISDRALAVLNALLSFHPETALTLPKPGEGEEEGQGESCDLVVFPSNRQLQGRAHSMAETTLRGHLAALVSAGLILRRDSANGKRYARRQGPRADGFSEAYGFDLSPLVVRATEFEALQEEMERERRLLQSLRTRITLHCRDISKMIMLGLDEGIPGPWEDYGRAFMGLVTPLRLLKSRAMIEQTHDALAELRAKIGKTLDSNSNVQNPDGNDNENQRHISNSKTQTFTNPEPSSKKEGGEVPGQSEACDQPEPANTADTGLPLALVLEACPDVATYHFGSAKITSWSDFQRAAETVRPMIGISPDAWHDACRTLTPSGAAIAVAMILQRSEFSSELQASAEAKSVFAEPVAQQVNGSPVIRSAGGYLRALTEKARAGAFTPGPMLMALIGQRTKATRQRRE